MSDQIEAWLDESRRLADQATEGPWEADLASQEGAIPDVIPHDGVYGTMERQDAEFVAEARTRFPKAVAALRAVMELHRPCHDAHGWTPCQECEQPWPCQTMQELDATLGLEGGNDEHLG